MRFGVMAIQMGSLIPSEVQDLPPEGVFGHVMGLDHATLVRQIAERGFKLIELNGDLAMLLPHLYGPAAIQDLAALKAELDLDYTVHLPLWSVEPATLNDPVRQGSVLALVDAIKTTLPLDPQVYVMHATGAMAAEFYRMQMPETVRTVLLRQFQGAARQSIQTILEVTGLPPRRLAIETIEFPLDLTLELASELNLAICFDTGHVLSGFSGAVEFFEALDRCMPYLAEIHLHDSPNLVRAGWREYGRDHLQLGDGELELARLLEALENRGFDGPVIFELQIPEALASLEAIRGYRPDIIFN